MIFDSVLRGATVATIGSIIILAHGFIATSLLWGSALAFVIDKKLKNAAAMLFICAVSLLRYYNTKYSRLT